MRCLHTKKSAKQKCFASANPLVRVRVVPNNTARLYQNSLQLGPIFLKGLPPSRFSNTVFAGFDRSHSYKGVWYDTSNQDPGNKVDSWSIKAMKEIML